MRTRQSAEFERAMKKCDGNVDIRKECERNETFKKEFIKSMRAPRELLEEVLGNMSLKEVPFAILQAATEEDIDFLQYALNELDEKFQDMNSINEIKNSQSYRSFIRSTALRERIFQVRKCNDLDCANT